MESLLAPVFILLQMELQYRESESLLQEFENTIRFGGDNEDPDLRQEILRRMSEPRRMSSEMMYHLDEMHVGEVKRCEPEDYDRIRVAAWHYQKKTKKKFVASATTMTIERTE